MVSCFLRFGDNDLFISLSNLSLALAEGKFTDEARLNVTEGKEVPPKNADGDIKIYDISLSDTDIKETDTVALRILNANRDKVTAWVMKGGKWEQVKVGSRGKYAVLQTKGTHNVICVKYSEKGFNFIWLIVVALTVCVISVIFLKRKKRRK